MHLGENVFFCLFVFFLFCFFFFFFFFSIHQLTRYHKHVIKAEIFESFVFMFQSISIIT